MRTVQQRSRMPREVEQSPPLEISKTQLDQALNNLSWPQSCPCFEQEAVLDTRYDPFQPELSHDPVSPLVFTRNIKLEIFLAHLSILLTWKSKNLLLEALWDVSCKVIA